jgi:hypothetical protein
LDEAKAAPFATPALRRAVRGARSTAHWLPQAEPRDAEAGATPFLDLLGTVLAA